MGIEVSIIVPVYNLEDLLPKCIESILSQTFTDFELILVNDGSTDNSGEICDRYSHKDNRVRVIHKENGGTASCRNIGLDIAKGKYIGFVDNDDYINKHMFEILYKNAIYYSSDIVVCQYQEVQENQNVDTNQLHSNYNVEHLNNISALNLLYTNLALTFVCPWNKLYKSSLFKDIRYTDGYINDDETVIHKLLYNSEKITYVQAELYYYLQRHGSQMNTEFHIKRLDKVFALKEREVYFRTKGEHELHQKALLHYMEKFFWYYHLASNLVGYDKEIQKLKATFDHTLFYLLKHKKISWKQKIMFVLFSFNPNLFELIIKLYPKDKISN